MIRVIKSKDIINIVIEKCAKPILWCYGFAYDGDPIGVSMIESHVIRTETASNVEVYYKILKLHFGLMEQTKKFGLTHDMWENLTIDSWKKCEQCFEPTIEDYTPKFENIIDKLLKKIANDFHNRFFSREYDIDIKRTIIIKRLYF